MSLKANKLNIGCGRDIKNDYLNLDSVKLPGVDVVHNLDKYPWPFKNNRFEEIKAFMILEHLEKWTRAMEEIHRITKNGAVTRITVPFFPSMYSVIDPTHKNFYTYGTFDYFEKKHGLNYYFKCNFKIKKKYIRFSWNPVLNLFSIPINWFPIFYSRYFSFIFPSNELYIELETVK
jgi:predicted SAM-dependent methyltransferase